MSVCGRQVRPEISAEFSDVYKLLGRCCQLNDSLFQGYELLCIKVNEWCFRPDSTLLGYTGPWTNWANEMNFNSCGEVPIIMISGRHGGSRKMEFS